MSSWGSIVIETVTGGCGVTVSASIFCGVGVGTSEQTPLIVTMIETLVIVVVSAGWPRATRLALTILFSRYTGVKTGYLVGT